MRAQGVRGALLGTFIVLWTGTEASAAPLTDKELALVEARVAPHVVNERKLSLERGGTVFIKASMRVPEKRLKGGPGDYIGLVTNVRAPNDIVVHVETDSWKFEKKGNDFEVEITYVVHASPTISKGGEVWASLKLLDRLGIGNEVKSEKIRLAISIVEPKPTVYQLAADFRGYRHFQALAKERRNKLAPRGVTLSLKDLDPPPQLVRASDQVIAEVQEFGRWRKRMWSAERHLQAASRSTDRATAALAKRYLALLDAKDDALGDLPLALTETKEAPVTSGVTQLGDGSSSKDPKSPKPRTGPGEIEELQPLETTVLPDEPEPSSRRDDPSADTKPPTETAPKKEEAVVEDVLTLMKKREVHIPRYTRGLILDDPNVGFSFATRMGWANAQVRGETSLSPAWFFSAQAGLTDDLGVELTVPLSFVRLDLTREPSLIYMGNPQVAAKYRFFLPEIAGRRATIVPRVRWGIPLQGQQTVPPTLLQARDFTVEPHFADLYAFLLEKHAIGGGASAAWDYSMLHIAAQLYLDAYIPTPSSDDPLSFLVISYGLSVGVRPIEYAGAFLEARGTGLLAGPGRHEVFTYFGVKGYLFDHIEPAIWVSLPLGSVGDVTGFQLGAELRFTYDIDGVIRYGKGRQSDRLQFLD